MRSLLLVHALGLAPLGCSGSHVSPAREATVPPTRYTREVRVPTTPDDVLRRIESLESWQRWDPWSSSSEAPNLSDPAYGVGAWGTWGGADHPAGGTRTIVSQSDRSIELRVEITTPCETTMTYQFDTVPVDLATTTLRWSVEHTASIGRAACSAPTSSEIEAYLESGLSSLRDLIVDDIDSCG